MNPRHRIIGGLLAKDALVCVDEAIVDLKGALAAREDDDMPSWDKNSECLSEDACPLFRGPRDIPALLIVRVCSVWRIDDDERNGLGLDGLQSLKAVDIGQRDVIR